MQTIENERNRSKQKCLPEVFYKKRCSGKFHKIHKKRPVPGWTRTKNHLVRKRTLNHLAKLAIWPKRTVRLPKIKITIRTKITISPKTKTQSLKKIKMTKVLPHINFKSILVHKHLTKYTIY